MKGKNIRRRAGRLLAMGLRGLFCLCVLAAAPDARAVDFRARGQWIMSFGYGQNGFFEGRYKGHAPTGFIPGQDNFEAKQKFSLHFEAAASEHVSGSLHLTTGDNVWGKSHAGGALGADTDHIKLKNAFID